MLLPCGINAVDATQKEAGGNGFDMPITYQGLGVSNGLSVTISQGEVLALPSCGFRP